jgi:hypothetical protein
MRLDKLFQVACLRNIIAYDSHAEGKLTIRLIALLKTMNRRYSSLGGRVKSKLTTICAGTEVELPEELHTMYPSLRVIRDEHLNLDGTLGKEFTERFKDFAPLPGNHIVLGADEYGQAILGVF